MKSIQPRKQRKMLYEMPSHRRVRLFSASLSPALRTSHGVNSVPLRTGDTVRIMRGDKKGSEAKINRVDRSRYRIFIEGITREKVDGTAVLIPIHPSKVMITSLNMDDKWRQESLKVAAPKEIEKPVEKARPVKAKKQRKARKPPKAPTEKAKAPRRRKAKVSEVEKAEEIKSG